MTGRQLSDDEKRREFSEIRQIHWWYQHNRALAARLLVRHVKPGIRSLDAGCRTGPNGAWLSAFGSLAVVSSDKEALMAYSTDAPGARTVMGRLDAMPFASNHIDVIVAISAIHDVDAGEPREIVAEYARILAPGGGICMIEPVWRPRGARSPGRFVSLPYLVGIAESAGLIIDRGTHANISTRIEGWVEPGAVRLGLGEVRRSDLEWGSRFVRNSLWFVAGLERTFLMSHDVGFGASAIVVAHKSRNGGN